MLFEAHPEIDIHEMSPLALAFAGDAVLELLVRQRLVETSRPLGLPWECSPCCIVRPGQIPASTLKEWPR